MLAPEAGAWLSLVIDQASDGEHSLLLSEKSLSAFGTLRAVAKEFNPASRYLKTVLVC